MGKTTLRAKAVLAILILACAACAPKSRLPQKPNDARSTLELLQHGPSPLCWRAVHRGNIAVWPGNTESGIRAAVAGGARLIEVDLRRNKDGSLFLFHDRRLNENNFAGPSNWRGRLSESLDNQELARLCFPPDRKTCAINLAKALELIAQSSSAYLIDAEKADSEMVRSILSYASSTNQLNQIIIQIPSVTKLELVRKLYPNAPILARCFNPSEVSLALDYKPDIIQIDETWMTKKVIEDIHRGSSKILVKTIDEDDSVEHHRRLFDAGVDIVLTDKIN